MTAVLTATDACSRPGGRLVSHRLFRLNWLWRDFHCITHHLFTASTSCLPSYAPVIFCPIFYITAGWTHEKCSGNNEATSLTPPPPPRQRVGFCSVLFVTFRNPHHGTTKKTANASVRACTERRHLLDRHQRLRAERSVAEGG